MDYQWDYPVAVLAHGGGYASWVDSRPEGDRHCLIVLTHTDRTPDVMERLGIIAAPRILQNAREFRWLVESLQHPVTHVAFDIDPQGDQANPEMTIAVDELIREHLIVDYSPWNYPIYVVAVGEGFASITGHREDDSPLHAIAVFREEKRAEAYVEATAEGEVCELEDFGEAVRFFTAMSDLVDAVALDPVIEDGQYSTKHCFAMQTLLDKYLVEERGDQDC